MLTIVLMTIIILAVCVALLSTGILLKKNGTFPSLHIDANPALRKQGITCAKAQHAEQQHRKNLEERLK
ncbi:MAG: hypothetical protein LBS05_03660 [Tannerellaceae bacterium]|jgi:hypothetical protein|nr:hypothetical protein [Tannerellaceae bacterium]